MPEKSTLKRARDAKREGKSPSTQAGAFVREEMDHIRQGKHGARSSQQAIAIGLSKARRAGVKLGAPKHASATTRKKAQQDTAAARKRSAPPSARRSRASQAALKREGHAAASHRALSRQARKGRAAGRQGR